MPHSTLPSPQLLHQLADVVRRLVGSRISKRQVLPSSRVDIAALAEAGFLTERINRSTPSLRVGS